MATETLTLDSFEQRNGRKYVLELSASVSAFDANSYVYNSVNSVEDATTVVDNGTQTLITNPAALIVSLSDAPVGNNYIHVVTKNISDSEVSNVVSVKAFGLSTNYLKRNYLKDILSKEMPTPYTIDDRKVAVVHNTAVADSLVTANYYINARGLNPNYLYGVDFSQVGSDDSQVGWFIAELRTFHEWALENKIEAVILSTGVPSSISGTHDASLTLPLSIRTDGWRVTPPAAFGLSKYFYENGGIYADISAKALAPDPSNKVFAKFFNDERDVAEQVESMPLHWYNDNTYGGGQDIYGNLPYDGVYIPSDVNFKSLYSTVNSIPYGRLGTTTGGTWVDNSTNTIRCIDDAIAAESQGRSANLSKNLVALNSNRDAGGLNGHAIGIVAKVLRDNGYPVVASTIWSGAATTLAVNPFLVELDKDMNLQEVFDLYSVPDDDFIRADLDAGTIDPQVDSFMSFGYALNNETTDTWTNSFNFLPGALHGIATSIPSNTLRSAMAAGACGGVGGEFEPQADNVTFLSPTLLGLYAGKSLMEAHYGTQQNTMSVYSYAAGDPLYRPFGIPSVKPISNNFLKAPLFN